jgi:hypothetical protein
MVGAVVASLVQNALFSASCPAPEFCAVGGVGKVLTSVDPSTPPTPQAPQGGGGSKGKKPNKDKVRPKRPRVILYSGVPDEVAIPAGKAFLQFRFHVKRRFQVRGSVCSFGHQKLHRCRSPRHFRVGPGRYRFRVRAVGWTGLRGPAAEQHLRVCHRPGVVVGTLVGCRAKVPGYSGSPSPSRSGKRGKPSSGIGS